MRGELKYEKSRSNSSLERRSKDRQLCQKIDHMEKYDSTSSVGNDRRPLKTHFEKRFEKYRNNPPSNSQKKSKTRIMLQRKCSKEENCLEKNSNRTLENKDRKKHKKNHHNLINQKKMKKITENARK